MPTAAGASSLRAEPTCRRPCARRTTRAEASTMRMLFDQNKCKRRTYPHSSVCTVSFAWANAGGGAANPPGVVRISVPPGCPFTSEGHGLLESICSMYLHANAAASVGWLERRGALCGQQGGGVVFWLYIIRRLCDRLLIKRRLSQK